MRCPNCSAPLAEDNALYCGNCGQPLASAGQTRNMEQVEVGPEVARPEASVRGQTPQVNHRAATLYSVASRNRQEYVEEAQVPQQRGPINPVPFISHANASPHLVQKNRIFFFALLILLAAVVITASIAAFQQKLFPNTRTITRPTTTAVTYGQIVFSDSQNNQGVPDSIRISIPDLQPPPPGTHDAVWLVNDETEAMLPLGVLKPQDQAGPPGKQKAEYALNMVKQGTNLLSLGNKLEVTQETADNQLLPTGKVLFTATFPPLAFVHIKHLLVAFPITPDQIGLLIGLRQQAQLVEGQAQQLKTNAENSSARQCIALNIIYLIEGKSGPDVQPFPQECEGQGIQPQGDGFGLLGVNSSGYVSLSAAHASLAATQPDSTALIKQQANNIVLAMTKLQQWLTTINQDTITILTQQDSNNVNEIAALADHVYNGITVNNTSAPDEAGATSAYLYGEIMATLAFKRGA